MNRFFTFLMLVAMSAAIFSCGEDEKEEVTPADPVEEKTQLLTNGSTKDWLITDAYENDKRDENECLYDNVITFDIDGSTMAKVNTPCYEGEADASAKWTWTFNESADSLSWMSNDRVFTYAIEITASKMTLTMKEEGGEDIGSPEFNIIKLHFDAK